MTLSICLDTDENPTFCVLRFAFFFFFGREEKRTTSGIMQYSMRPVHYLRDS